MMIRHANVNTVHDLVAQLPQPRVLVPTMGALHEGHLALLRRARKLAGNQGSVVVSIFVNPIQFDRAADLLAYPRTLERDLELCEAAGVDFAFLPEKEDFYRADHSVLVTENSLSQRLCGATRPGHFDGVLTVVLKLFALLQPKIAVFGEKDYQQLALVRRMVRDLNLPVTVESLPTVRARDGLALSSRNARLSEADRSDAVRLHAALQTAKNFMLQGEKNVAEIVEKTRNLLLKNAPANFTIDYLDLLDSENLQPIENVEKPAVLAMACYYGEVRLIDNVVLRPSPFK